jgi:predicted dehydrogenase
MKCPPTLSGNVQQGKAFRWGLAGYGDLPQRRLIDALTRPPNRLESVWGRDTARAAAFAQQFNIPRAAVSLHELVQDVDAVYVAVPPVAHLPVAIAAVQAGRNVLIEKPLSPTFLGYEKLLALVAGMGVKAAVSYYRRFAPVMQRLRQILHTGQLGLVRSVELNFASSFNPRQDDPKAWRLDPAIAGGGVTADAGSHRLDLLCWLFGSGKVVNARTAGTAGGTVDRVADMTLLFSSGVSAHCRFAWEEIKVDRLVIRGDTGTATLDPLDRGRLHFETANGTHIFEDAPPPNLHRDVVQAFQRWTVLGTEEPLCTLPEAHAVDVILEAVYGGSQESD